MKTNALLTVVLAFAVALSACKKKDEAPPPGPSGEPTVGEPKEQPKEGPTKAAETAEPAKPADATPAEPAKPADNVALVDGLIQAMNEGKLDVFLQGFAETVEIVMPGMEPSQGLDGVKKFVEMSNAGFSNVKVTKVRVIDAPANNTVVVHSVWSGTHSADWMGIPATNKTVAVDGLCFYGFENGKVVKWFHYFDMAAVMGQLAPAEGQPVRAPAVAPETADLVKGEAVAANLEAIKGWYGAAMADAVAVMEKIGAADLVGHDLTEAQDIAGLEGFKAYHAKYSAGFPDGKAAVDDIFSVGPFVVSRVTWTGTHSGDIGPIKATGKAVTLHMAEIYRFDGEKVKEFWTFMNAVELLGQLGLLPAPAPAGDAPAPAPAPASDAPAAGGTAPAPAPAGDTPAPAPAPAPAP